MFMFAATLDVLCFVKLKEILPQRLTSLLRALAWADWSAGFGVQAFLTFITSRKPPEFNIHWVEVPWVLVIANFCRGLGAAMGLLNETLMLAGLYNMETQELSVAALWTLFLGNSLHLFSVVFFEVNSEQGFDTTFLFQYRNLPHWAVFGLALSSLTSVFFHAVTSSVLTAEDEWVLQAIAMMIMSLSVLMLRYWSMSNNWAMRRYYKASEARHKQIPKTIGAKLPDHTTAIGTVPHTRIAEVGGSVETCSVGTDVSLMALTSSTARAPDGGTVVTGNSRAGDSAGTGKWEVPNGNWEVPNGNWEVPNEQRKCVTFKASDFKSPEEDQAGFALEAIGKCQKSTANTSETSS